MFGGDVYVVAMVYSGVDGMVYLYEGGELVGSGVYEGGSFSDSTFPLSGGRRRVIGGNSDVVGLSELFVLGGCF